MQVYVGSDQLDELDESFALELSNPTRASFGGSNQSLQALGWVLDDDGSSVNRTLAVSNPTVVEGESIQSVKKNRRALVEQWWHSSTGA